MSRKRYQRGSIRREGNSWVFRWREDELTSDGDTKRVLKRETLGSTSELPFKIARRAADKILQDRHVNAIDNPHGGKMVATLEQFWEIYQADVGPVIAQSTFKQIESAYRRYLLPELGRYRLFEIQGQPVQRLISKLKKLRSKNNPEAFLSDGTVKGAVNALASLLKCAKNLKYMCELLDWDALELPDDEPIEEARFFTPAEAQSIIDAAPWPWCVAFAIMVYCGLRTGEVLALNWNHVQIDGAMILVYRSAWHQHIKTVKSKSSRRVVPMPPALLNMLIEFKKKHWRSNPDGLLFANRKGKVTEAHWVRSNILHPIREQLGIPPGAFHAFRHSHGTVLMGAAGDPKIVQTNLGHGDLAMVGWYSHDVPENRRKAVERAAETYVNSRRRTGTETTINHP